MQVIISVLNYFDRITTATEDEELAIIYVIEQ